jgi:hypothetical protein
MAREIIIYEQTDLAVSVIYLYVTRFIRLGQKFPLTPITELGEEILVLFEPDEKLKLSEGDLSYEFGGTIQFPEGMNVVQRNQRLKHRYREQRRLFREANVAPKMPPVEYIDL